MYFLLSCNAFLLLSIIGHLVLPPEIYWEAIVGVAFASVAIAGVLITYKNNQRQGRISHEDHSLVIGTHTYPTRPAATQRLTRLTDARNDAYSHDNSSRYRNTP